VHGVTKSTVCRIIDRVGEAIHGNLFSTIIKWPEDTLASNQTGASNGTLVPLDAPVKNEAAYVDRHGNHSIIALMICGPDMKFYYVSAC